MNKFLLSFGLVALLAGCDRPAQNDMPTQPNTTNQTTPVNQMAPGTPENPVRPSAPATTDNRVHSDNSSQMQTTTPSQGALAGQEQPDTMVRSNDQPNESSSTPKTK